MSVDKLNEIAEFNKPVDSEDEELLEAQNYGKLIDEAVSELQSLLARIKKEPTSRRTKEVLEKRQREAAESWKTLEELKRKSGESTSFGLVEKEKLRFASELIAKIGETLESWKGKWGDESGLVDCPRAIVNDRAIQLAILKRVIDRCDQWEAEVQSPDDLHYMEQKLKSSLNEFEAAHEKVPQGFKESKQFEAEAVSVRDKVIFLVSGINLKKLEMGDKVPPPRAKVVEPLEADCVQNNQMDQFERMLKLFQSLKAPSSSSINLPRLEIPTFDGNTKNWLYFKGSYESAVHKNKELDDITKMRYLLNSVKGEAWNMINQFSLSTENYHTVWELLLNRYDNKKLLITTYLDRLLNISPAKLDTAGELKAVIDGFKEALFTLKNLGEDTWNAMVVHLLCRKLPDETIKAWEQHVGHLSVFPDFSQLDKFLENRISTLTLLEEKRRQTNSQCKVMGEGGRVTCADCGDGHPLYRCMVFSRKSVADRNELVRSKKLCTLCLNEHLGKDCQFKFNCNICRGRHNSLLHWPRDGERLINAGMTENNFVLLPTALITLESQCGVPFTFRALVDQGSSVSAVSEKLMTTLKWKRRHCSSTVAGVGDTRTECNGSTDFYLNSRYDDTIKINVTAIIMNRVTKALPKMASKGLNEFKNLDLADPRYFEGGKIDIILGSDVIPSILLDHTIHGTLLAQRTHLGFILSGPIQGATNWEVHSYGLVASEEDENRTLQKFWETEEKLLDHSGFSTEEEECERIYQETTFVGSDGRYVCRLPFRANSSLGRSRHIALANYYSLEKKFTKNPKFKERYVEAMNNYFDLRHAHVASPLTPGVPHYYIPHLAVIKDSSSTTKTRIVFNASSPTSNRRSLNDNLLVGPTIQGDITDKIISFRVHKFVFSCDIVKMYRQININPLDFNFQRFIWRVDGEIKDCFLSTVTFGTGSAPFTATRTLVQLANDQKNAFPLGASILATKAYVDDIHYGNDNEEQVKKGMNETIELLKTASFEVRKFASNKRSVIEGLPQDYVESQKETKFMGIVWNSEEDTFRLAPVEIENYEKNTKRNILKNIAKIFDPLGWFQPIIVRAKILMQEIWKSNCKWDDVIDESLQDKWKSLQSSLLLISSIRIPRHFSCSKRTSIELHGFSDASEVAYGAVIYLKLNANEAPWLLISKSRVAPIKNVSIPRLELKGALLLSNIMNKIRGLLEAETLQVKCHGWCDSKVTLAWLQAGPEKWQPFVRNRVATIQENVPDMIWHYVSSENNPADVVSRGCEGETFKQLTYWFRGPLWLQEGKGTIDGKFEALEEQEKKIIRLEEKREVILLSTQITEVDWVVAVARKFESFKFACRVFAWVKRFLGNCRGNKINRVFVSVEECIESERMIIRRLQEMYFFEELKSLENTSLVAPTSILRSLCPFVDQHGILRVGGRIQKAHIKYDQRHPMIMSAKEPVVLSIIRETHKMLYHGGFAVTMNMLRKKFWIVKGGQVVKGIVSKCVSCIRSRPKWSNQLMGILPSERVQFSKPFAHTGVDFAGPVKIRATTGRGVRSTKGYIAVFVCMGVKAFHLEVVSSLSADSFLAALSRFISRRGRVDHLYSDNGTNFVGAFKKLNDIDGVLSRKGIEWHFIPPLAPNFGGLWEAGVRSVKTHLSAQCGVDSFTFEELATLLCEVEICLNARPLCPLVEDIESLDALTPQHFLTQEVGTDLDGRDFKDVPLKYLSRWEEIKKARQELCYRYKNEYLSRLNNRPKNMRLRENLKTGQLVLLREENGCSGWPLGRITAVYPGPDGLIRVVSVRTATGEKKRAVSRICPLGMLESPVDLGLKAE